MENAKYIYGRNPVKENLKIVKKGVLFVSKSAHNASFDDIVSKAKAKNIEVSFVDNAYFAKFFGDKNHQGVVLKIDEGFTEPVTEKGLIAELKNNSAKVLTVLILDGVEDVGNLGAVLRSALLFGVEHVILPKDNSAPINEIVMKRSAGAASHLKIVYATNIVRMIEELKEAGFWIYAADKGGESIGTVKFAEKRVIVIGSEDKGIRPLVKKNCDVVITIPTNDKLDSLNLSVSAGIILSKLFSS